MLVHLITLISPITEALPNLYMSWWKPPNGNIEKYNQLLWLRVICVIAVWSSVLWILYENKNNKLNLYSVLLLTFTISLAFQGRAILDYNNPIPGLIYAFVLLCLSLHLYKVKQKWRIWLSYILIILGAYVISVNRPKVINGDTINKIHLAHNWKGYNFWINIGKVFRNSEIKDIMGRIKFIIGFINFIYIISF